MDVSLAFVTVILRIFVQSYIFMIQKVEICFIPDEWMLQREQ